MDDEERDYKVESKLCTAETEASWLRFFAIIIKESRPYMDVLVDGKIELMQKFLMR